MGSKCGSHRAFGSGKASAESGGSLVDVRMSIGRILQPSAKTRKVLHAQEAEVARGRTSYLVLNSSNLLHKMRRQIDFLGNVPKELQQAVAALSRPGFMSDEGSKQTGILPLVLLAFTIGIDTGDLALLAVFAGGLLATAFDFPGSTFHTGLGGPLLLHGEGCRNWI